MDFKDNSEFYYFEAKNGKIDGKRLHNNANTRSQYEYSEGKPHGRYRYYNNGRATEEGLYKNGERMWYANY